MSTLTEVEEDVLIQELIAPTKAILVLNDDVNTFEHVIDCLIKYCGHDPEQAHQCALIIHTKGKYPVKHGDYDKLKPICEALLENKLTAKITD